MREEYSLFEAVHQNVADLSARIEELEASKSEGGHQDVEIVAGVQAQMQVRWQMIRCTYLSAFKLCLHALRKIAHAPYSCLLLCNG